MHPAEMAASAATWLHCHHRDIAWELLRRLTTELKTTGQPVAWYNGRKAPCFFEAGMPVDKKPAKIPANVFIKQIGIDSVVVAHFHGPYELLPQAYEALDDYMKGRKRKLKAKPYEIYVDDPMDKDGKMKDPYKVQTDVVYPWK